MCVVTCYFKIKSKHPDSHYISWMKHMLAMETPMVIFCDKESYPMIHAQRPYFTKIIITTLEELHSYKYIDTYRANYEVDHETYHSPELYVLWSEKIHFLKQAITMNPFHSDYFLWVDIGCFRISSPIKWPNPERIASLDNTKVLALNVTPFTEEELHCTKETLPSFLTTNRLGATIFGGGKEALLRYHALYYEMVEYFISMDRFIGKDQSILNSVYLLNQDLFHLVKPGPCKDPWFYLQDYFSVRMKRKVIIWGFPLHTHTHSYIHYGWYKGFKYLGYETYWFDDTNYPTEFDFSNCLFITEGYADDRIPIVDSSVYVVHIARDPTKYIGKVKQFLEIRYLVDSIKDSNYHYTLDKSKCKKISDCTYYEKLTNNGGIARYHDAPEPMKYECIYTCWATDLLPHEIVEDTIYMEREKKIYWFGSSSPYYCKELKLFEESCNQNGIEFIVNNPWTNPKTFEEVQEYTMKSFLAPDIRSSGDPSKIAMGESGTCHKQIGYIACRLLKSISYGHLGVTNSKHTYELLGKKLVYHEDEGRLFYEALKQKHNITLIKEQMKLVREKHTYLNRIDDLLVALSEEI